MRAVRYLLRRLQMDQNSRETLGQGVVNFPGHAVSLFRDGRVPRQLGQASQLQGQSSLLGEALGELKLDGPKLAHLRQAHHDDANRLIAQNQWNAKQSMNTLVAQVFLCGVAQCVARLDFMPDWAGEPKRFENE